MASELKLTINFSYADGEAKVDKAVSNLGVDVTGTVLACGVQNVDTSEEALGLNGVTAGGYLFLRNLDSTNYVSLRSGTGATNVVRLKAGEVAVFRLDAAATAPFVIANTAAVDLEFALLSD